MVYIQYSGKLSREKTVANFAVLYILSISESSLCDCLKAQCNPRKFSLQILSIKSQDIAKNCNKPSIKYCTKVAKDSKNSNILLLF